MNNNKIEIEIADELRTPIDKRTSKRKAIEKRTREVVPHWSHKYGIWTHLTIKDVDDFTNNLLYNVN